MVPTTLPASPNPVGEPEDNAPASGGRRRIVPFVPSPGTALRSESTRAGAKAGTPAKAPKSPKAASKSKAPRGAATTSLPAAEDTPQTLVPMPRRSLAAESKTAPAPMKKDAFILSFPRDVRASEVQAAGATQGLAITLGYVHWVRSRAKAVGNARVTGAKVAVRSRAIAGAKAPRTVDAREGKPAARGAQSGSAPNVVPGHASRAIATAAIASLPAPSRDRASAERLIIDTAARSVGIDRAIALLTSARERVGRLLEP